jgi:hypothetical protein
MFKDVYETQNLVNHTHMKNPTPLFDIWTTACVLNPYDNS